MQFYLLQKLPLAFFAGIKVKYCDGDKSVVALPFTWRSQNPFRSVYFAAQIAAAELSTGVLFLAGIYPHKDISMLVIRSQAEFLKKADGDILFTCKDGNYINQLINEAISSGESRQILAKSVGRLANGTVVSEVQFEWSVKQRTSKV